jgi:hypothetical protein
MSSTTIDNVICAELPDPLWDVNGSLWTIVAKQMTHGPCHGKACCPLELLADRLWCQKQYPWPFRDETVCTDDQKAEYRRQSGDTYMDDNGRTVNNH